MLNIPAPFPQVGSYALHRVSGGYRLARIQRREAVQDEELALISYPARPGASGSLTVAMHDLIDGTPLSGEERLEFAQLSAGLPARRAARIAAARRLTVLAERRIFSKLLTEEMIRAGLARRELNTEAA